jgi:hypothetical protein
MADGKGIAIVWRSRNAGCRSQEAGTAVCIGVDSDQQRQNDGDLGYHTGRMQSSEVYRVGGGSDMMGTK